MKKIHIEFQRVQTWLFSVPRLRAMVGANTLLGEVLRVNLKNLALQPRADWSLEPFSPSLKSLCAGLADPIDTDDPFADAKLGILSRDGGHFEAQFSEGAEKFATAATSLLQTEVPGLRFVISIDRKPVSFSTPFLSKELPVFSPCSWTGRDLASVTIQQGSEKSGVSLDVSRRHEAAQRAETGSAQDLASLLVRKSNLGQRPHTFEGLAGRGYLAVIHADGNGVGGGVGDKDEDRLPFFHRNRVLIRAALKHAIDQHGKTPENDVAPLVVLMLGGDDLLVACQARIALPFVKTLCEKLKDLQEGRDANFHLTLGIGVAIARPSLPFHRLHAVAEALASSAKRKFRGLAPNEQASVVDWAVYTGAWADDPATVRARDWICGPMAAPRVLSRRPLVVLGDEVDRLEGLLRKAQKLTDAKAPRSQLRYLVDQLGRGRALADLAFAEMPSAAKTPLASAGITEIWSQAADSPSVTSLLDLVEIWEIRNLGRAGTAVTEYPAGELSDEAEDAHA